MVYAPQRSGRIGLSSKTSKTDAEAKFARTQKRATDAARAMNDAAAESKRIDENTLRLRALRLAKEAKDAAEKAAAPAVKAKPAKAAAKPAAAKPAKAIPVKKLNARNDG